MSKLQGKTGVFTGYHKRNKRHEDHKKTHEFSQNNKKIEGGFQAKTQGIKGRVGAKGLTLHFWQLSLNPFAPPECFQANI